MDAIKSDKQNETRISQLQREYRKAAGVSVATVNSNMLKRLKGDTKRKNLDFHLKQLAAERDLLDKRIFVAYGKDHEENQEKIVNKMQIQVKNLEEMRFKISGLKTDVTHLQSQLDRLDDEQIELSTKHESEDQFHEYLRKSRIQLQNFESRLENMQHREGIAIAKNERLRSLIENMLSDRCKFNAFWRKYIASLSSNKKFLLDMIERAILAFNQGEDLCFKLDSLRFHSTREKKKDVDLMLKKKRKQDSNRNMTDFLGGKGKKRDILPLEKRELERRSELKRTYNQNLNFYKELIEKIQKLAGVDGIVQSLQKYELQNNAFFSSFTYLMEINSQIEFTRNSLKDVNDDYYASNSRNLKQLAHSENHAILLNQNLKMIIENTLVIKSNRHKYDNEIIGFFKTINEFLVSSCSILWIFNILSSWLLQTLTKCDLSFKSILGDTKPTVFNLHKYLAALEQRMNNVVAVVYCDQRLKMQTKQIADDQLIVKNVQRNLNHPVAIKDIVLMQQCAECAEGEDVNRYDEETIYPLKFDAIKEKVCQKVQTPEMLYRLHNISQCRLPRSRTIVNRRYL